MFFLHLLLSVLLPVGYSHVGDGYLHALQSPVRLPSFCLSVSTWKRCLPRLCFFGPDVCASV